MKLHAPTATAMNTCENKMQVIKPLQEQGEKVEKKLAKLFVNSDKCPIFAPANEK